MSIIYNNVKIAGVGKNGKDGTGFTLFTPIWQDHLVNNASWLRADTFSWQSGAVYVAAYNHLVNDFNGTTSATETIGSMTITYYRSEDGHKIVLPDQENNVMSIYNVTGIAWYYILDTTNKRFKLPRNKYGFTGFRDGVGNYVPESLPDLVALCGHDGISGEYKQKLSQYSYTSDIHQLDTSGASTASASYGSEVVSKNNRPIQSRSIEMYLYFFVGNTVEEVTTINVGQLTESLNGKADTSLNNIPTNYDYVVESKFPTTEDPSWYRVYKSGWVEQGGTAQASNNVINVTLTKPYINTYYVINATYRGGGSWPAAIQLQNITTTSFTIAVPVDWYINWEAKGQGAS